MNGFNISSASDIYYSGNLVKWVYIGNKKVWDYKTPPVYTAPTAKTGLVYTGSAQALLNSGSTSHGTFKYSSDGSTWGTTVPYATNASNSIKVYWKLEGDGRHNDVSSTEITTSIAKTTGSVSISGVTIDYNGSARNLAIVNNPTGTMHYRLGTSGSWLTTIPQATNHTESAYEVYWYMDASTNYNGLHSSSSPAKVTSTISKINPTITAPTAKTNVVYTGSELTLWNAGSNTTAGSFSYGKGTNAGTYSSSWSFTPTDTTNYNSIGGSASIVISKASASISYATTSISKTYGNSAFTNTLTKSGDGSVTYASSNTAVATVNSSGQVTIVKAGSCTITATVTDGANYTYATKTASYTLSISARTVTVTAPTRTNRTYTGDALTIFALGSCTTGGTMYYSDTNKTFSTSTWTTSLPYTQKTNAGTYTMYYYCYVSDTINNTGSDINTIKSVSATINQGARSGAVSCNNVTYGSTVQASISVSPSSWTGGTVTWGITNGTGTATINSSGVVTPTSVGTVTITASIGASGNYAGYTATSKQITISQRTVTPTAPTATNRNYTGSAQTIFSAGSSTAGGTMYYSDTNKAFSTSTWSTSLPYSLKTNAGTYTIYWYCYVSDTTNNTGTNINTIKSISATINKVAAVLPTTWAGDSKEYHNTASLTVSGYSGGSIKYRYDTNNGTSWTETTTAPTRTSVGNTAVQCMIVGDSNHTDTSWSSTVTLSVYKAGDARMTVSPSSTLTYTGSAQTIATASDAHGISTYYIGYKKDALATADNLITWNSASTTPLQATGAGDYYIYYKFTVDGSHTGDKAYTYVGKTTINKKSRSGSVSCNNVTYGSTVTASVSGNTESGTITWGIIAGTGTATISGGVVTPTKVGTVTITASVAATANYAAYTATSKEITISLRTVTWSAPTRTHRTYNGSDQTIFAVGSCSTGGTMQYSSDNSTWSTSLPYSLKKEPGTYTIYYRCYVSDTTNNTGTNINTSRSLSATIYKIYTNAPILTAGTKTTYDGNWVYATAKNGSGNPAGTIYYGASSGSTSYGITASSSAQNLGSMGRRDVGSTTIYAFFRPTDTSHYYDSSSVSTTASVTNRATGSSGSVSNPSAQTYKTSGTYSYTIGIAGATGTVTYPASFSVNGTTWSCNTSTGVVTVPQGTNAGSYTLTGNITVAQSTNYNSVSATSKTWTITINKASQSAPLAADSTVNYHNTAYGSASSGGGQGSLYYRADTNGGLSYGTATTSAPSRSAVGTTTYVAYWGGNTNYYASPESAAKSLVVNKATDASVTVTLTGRNYTGSALTIASATSHGCTYYLGTGTSSAVSSWTSANTSITATNAGTYYIWYKGTADSNHNGNVVDHYKGSVIINKINPTITAPTGKTGLTYNGSSQTLYNAGSNTTAGSFSYTNGTRTDAGTQTVNWSFTPTDTINYNSLRGSFNVTIARSNTASASASNKTYNGTAQTGVTGSNVSWSGTTSATNAGTYTAYATPDGNHTWSNGGTEQRTITWTMYKAPINPSVSIANWTYGQTASNPTVTGNLGGGAVTYYYKIAPNSDSTYTTTKPSGANYGTHGPGYTVKAVIGETDNYLGHDCTSKFYINMVESSISLTERTLTYSGNAQQLCYATYTGGTPSFRLDQGVWSENSIPFATNAGTYTVYAYIPGDSNYTSAYSLSNPLTCTVTIKPASRTVSFITQPTLMIAGDDWTSNASASVNVGSGTWTYTSSNTSVASIVHSGDITAWSAGTTTITASISASGNYAAASASYTLTVKTERDRYLTLEAITNCTFRFATPGTTRDAEYSYDGSTWYYTKDSGGYTVNIQVGMGQRVMFRGLITAPSDYTDGIKNCFQVMSDCRYKVMGNPASLYTTSFATITKAPAALCFFGLFQNQSCLTDASKLSLPFTLVSNCYRQMFYGCSNLTTAPVLPATSLVSNCYYRMFYGCSSLNYIKAMFTTSPRSAVTSNWVYGVASSGTFVKNSAATWTTTGAHAVPTGWTVTTASS